MGSVHGPGGRARWRLQMGPGDGRHIRLQLLLLHAQLGGRMSTIERWKITDRAEWLQRRRKNINGSEVAALFGVNPFMTNLALYAEKAGLADMAPPDSAVMRRGRIMEPAVAAGVMEEKPEWELQKAAEYLWQP